MKAATPKPRRAYVTNPQEIAALKTAPRWREGTPLIWPLGDVLLAEADVLPTWREGRSGKNLCRHE